MSEGFAQAEKSIKDLKICPKCQSKIKQDIFVLDYGRKKKRNEPGLAECRACFECKLIYEVIS